MDYVILFQEQAKLIDKYTLNTLLVQLGMFIPSSRAPKALAFGAVLVYNHGSNCSLNYTNYFIIIWTILKKIENKTSWIRKHLYGLKRES